MHERGQAAAEDDERVAVAQKLVLVRRPVQEVGHEDERHAHEEERHEPRDGRGRRGHLDAVEVEHADDHVHDFPFVRLESARLHEPDAVGRHREDVAREEHADEPPHRDEQHHEVRDGDLHGRYAHERAEVGRHQHEHAEQDAGGRLARENAEDAHAHAHEEDAPRAQEQHEQQQRRHRQDERERRRQERLPHAPDRPRERKEQRAEPADAVEEMARPFKPTPLRKLLKRQHHVRDDEVGAHRADADRRMAHPHERAVDRPHPHAYMERSRPRGGNRLI